jgi:hypothetical protein
MDQADAGQYATLYAGLKCSVPTLVVKPRDPDAPTEAVLINQLFWRGTVYGGHISPSPYLDGHLDCDTCLRLMEWPVEPPRAIKICGISRRGFISLPLGVNTSSQRQRNGNPADR